MLSFPDYSVLEPFDFPEGDEYRDPEVFRTNERYWWHNEIAKELRRLKDAGYSAYNVAGIAGNIKRPKMDTYNNIRQMLTWGELDKADPLWDHEPNTWVKLKEND